MRSIWQGSISFGLVNIPVKLFSAVNPKSIKFRLVHNKDKAPIQYRKFCSEEEKEVPLEEISRAIEVSKGNYYILKEDELEKLKPEKSDLIEVKEFVNLTDIDSIYFNSHYYLAPNKAKDKAFFLFRKVLQDTGKAAIARFVMREKEHTCVISSYKNGILLTTLNYQYEIRDISEVTELNEEPELKTTEMNLAKKLIQQLTEEEFRIENFKDNYEEQLKELIKKKEKGEPIHLPQKRKGKKEKENLIEALRASLR